MKYCDGFLRRALKLYMPRTPGSNAWFSQFMATKKAIKTASTKAQIKLKSNVMCLSVVIKEGVRGKKREKPKKKAERDDDTKAQVEITNQMQRLKLYITSTSSMEKDDCHCIGKT